MEELGCSGRLGSDEIRDLASCLAESVCDQESHLPLGVSLRRWPGHLGVREPQTLQSVQDEDGRREGGRWAEEAWSCTTQL